MPRFFMYLPWDDDKRLAEAACSFTDRLERLGGYKETFVIGRQHLEEAEIENNDDLYISGDCAPNAEFIGSKDGRTMQAKELAAQFDGALDKGHRCIHIWACYSGHGMEGVVSPQGKIGLAYRFWEAMHALGYNKLSVFGYRFAVLDPFSPSQADLLTAQLLPGFKSLTETPDKAKFLPGNANNWMTGLDPSGKVIPPAPLPKPVSLQPLKS
jgi:hypothetical protein